MSDLGGVAFERFDGPIETVGDQLLGLCRSVFPDFEDYYLLDRLPRLDDPDLWIARRGAAWIGFKLAYRRGPDLLYSWLGGVEQASRGQGVAARLMVLQHQGASERGFRFVETRTRTSNNAMIILNLRHGFQLCGHETDARGRSVVIQRKAL